MLRVRCYLDDLNFHHRAAKPTSFKWIDLEALFCDILTEKLEQEVSIEQLKLFVATVSGDAKERQKIYFNALQKHSDRIDIQLGKFKKIEKSGVLKSSQNPQIVTIINESQEPLEATISVREEKQTDVNLAVSMVNDAHLSLKGKTFDMACLISNDSDLKAALLITKKLVDTVLITPVIGDNQSSKELICDMDKNRIVSRIDPDLLKKHLLPEQVGKYHAPKGWLGP